ncbi:MAG: phenylacetate--CoA ligase family protein [Anaerolineales bacterium]|nr:phenylacetate--CoA ligase family protein [Anaerolineales bacterium]
MSLTPLEPWIAQKTATPSALTPLTNDDRRPTKVDEAFDLRPSPLAPRPSLSQSALDAHQLACLRATLALARSRSAFYRRLLGDAVDVNALAELARLPFTTADDVRADPLAFVCVSQDDIQRVVTLDSSGTTGAPKRLYFTRADQELTIDFFAAGMSTFTGPGDRVLILLPGETPGSVGDLLATGLHRIGAVPIKHGPVRDAALTREVAIREAATVIVGVPTHLLRLVRTAPPGAPVPPVHSVLLSTDHVPQAIVKAIETAWGCRVYNHYGMTEMGLGGGVDCVARRGYHLREADLLFEVVDPLTGAVLPDGEQGEVVFTTLTRVGMPLIRYRTGDYGRWITKPCPCGTALRTLAHITTRITGPVDLGGGVRLAQPELDEALFAIDGVLNFATVAQTPPGGSHLTVALQITSLADPIRVQTSAQAALWALPAIATTPQLSLDLRVTTEAVTAPTLAKRAIRLNPPGGE